VVRFLRRLFIVTLATLSTGHAAAVQENIHGPAAPSTSAIRLAELPLLFADDSGVFRSEGVVTTVHPAQTDKTPVLCPDRPWEGCRLYASGSVYYDETDHLFRLWYAGGGMLFATSKDGIHWDKPSLGIYDYKGSKTNNIAFKGFACPSVLLDRRETDPAKRYKLVGSRVEKGYHAATSPDGLHWTEIKQPIFMYHDTITLAQDPRTGDYLAYHKRHWDWRGLNRRTVWLSRSRDFQTWSEPKLVFAPDAEDDTWARGPKQRTEVYNMTVLPHAAGFLGLPTMFRVTDIIPARSVQPEQSPADGPIHVQLVTSTDGENWQRTSPRTVVIPNGPPGSFDAGCILNVSSTAATTDQETWLYYTGVNTTHGGTMPPKRMSLGRAVWRRYGFVSLDAADRGRVETRPLRLGTSTLTVNADARHGQLLAAVSEEDGRAIPGLSVEVCEPLRADATRHALQWRSGRTPPTDRPVRVVIEMQRCHLFSLECR
jgi:hypothetical protein